MVIYTKVQLCNNQ